MGTPRIHPDAESWSDIPPNLGSDPIPRPVGTWRYPAPKPKMVKIKSLKPPTLG